MEHWKDIPWLEWSYQASNLGNIRSGKRWYYRNLVTYKNKNWYNYVSLDKKCTVHRIIAKTFIDNPDNKPFINHKDWNKTNNDVDNLEWCTRSENEFHKYRVLWYKWPKYWITWKDHFNSKPITQFNTNLEIIKEWYSASDVVRELKISAWCLSNVLNWKRKTTWWFIWKFKT